MPVVFGEPEFAFYQTGAAACIDEPTRFSAMFRAIAPETHAVSVRIDVDRADDGAVLECRTEFDSAFGKKILEDAAIDLITRRREHAAHAEFGHARDIVAAFAEEKPEAEFAELLAIEMVFEPEHRVEIMRADLDRRFTDLERRVRRRAFATLKHTHR